MKRVLVFFCLLTLCMLLSASLSPSFNSSPSQVYSDEIVVHGTVEVWSLEDANSRTDYYSADQNHAQIAGGRYIPARFIYMQEEFVSITSDPEGYTNQYGDFYLKKSGLSEGDYDVNLEIRANAILGTYGGPLWPSRVKVSIFQDSTDIYEINGQTPAKSYHTGTDNEVNIHIGGPEDSGANQIQWEDDVYCAWSLYNCRNYAGEDDHQRIHPVVAFWMTQKLQDYFTKVIRLAPNMDEISHDTWIIYPAMNDKITHYGAYAPPPGVGSIDMVDNTPLFPSQFEGVAYSYVMGDNWVKYRQTLFHEYSHKIMHDVYWAIPKPNVDQITEWGGSEHDLETCRSQELAWTEGFGGFLPAAISGRPNVDGIPGNGNLEYSYYPPEYLNKEGFILDTPFVAGNVYNKDKGKISWHYNVTRECAEPRNNEGEVAAVLWDIFDMAGWEYMNAIVQSSRPLFWNAPLMFYDRLSDPYLTDIWSEVRNNSPDSINDEGDLRLDSFWTDWVNKTYKNNLEKIHGLKAILFNRGITTTSRPENPPKVESLAIDETTHKLNVTISEPDVEDRKFLYFNVGYMKRDQDTQFSYYYPIDKAVSDLSQNWQNGQLTFSVDIPRGKLGRTNGLLVHDSMLIGYRGQNLRPQETLFNLQCTNRTPTNTAGGIAIQGSYAYVADMESGLLVYDLSKPLQPVLAAVLAGDANHPETPWYGAMDVDISGDYAYVAAYSGALVVVDISQPTLPQLAGYLSLGGEPRAVAVSGNRAYVGLGGGGLKVVGLPYPASPFDELTLSTSGVFDVAINAGQALVAGEGGLSVYDLGFFPTLRGTISIPGDVVTGVAADAAGLIYLATRNNSLQIYDITTWNPALASLSDFMHLPADPDVASPTKLDELKLPRMPGRIKIDGSRLYASGGVYDITEPELVYQMAASDWMDGAVDFAVLGDTVYALEGDLLVFSPSSQPGDDSACGTGSGQGQGTGQLEQAGVWQGHANDMVFAGDYGFLAAGEEGLKVISVADPSNMPTLANYDKWAEPYRLNAMGVEVNAAGQTLYLSSLRGDLQILDISTPVAPERLAIVDWNRREEVGQWSKMDEVDRLVYLCAGTGGVREVFVGNPGTPNWGGIVSDAMTDCTSLAASPDTLYGLGSSSGLHILNTHDKLDITPLADWALPQSGVAGNFYSGLFLDKNAGRLYVAAHFSGLFILDVTAPANPRQIGRIDTGKALSVAVENNFAYVGDNQQVHVIDISSPASPRIVQSVPLSPIPDLEITAVELKVHQGYLYVITDRDTLLAFRIIP